MKSSSLETLRLPQFDQSAERREQPMSRKRWKELPGKQLPTAAELRLLQILWEIGEATVEGVVNAHRLRERPNYKTTQTLLRIMEQKRLVTHETSGRVFVFRPLISRKTIDHRCVRALLSRNFDGSVVGLLFNLLETATFGEKDLNELEAQIREYRRRNEANAIGARV